MLAKVDNERDLKHNPEKNMTNNEKSYKTATKMKRLPSLLRKYSPKP